MSGRLLIKDQEVMAANINWQHKPAVDKLKLASDKIARASLSSPITHKTSTK
jgi:hypothetical protein